MKYLSKFILKLIRPSTYYYQSFHQVSRLQLQKFLRDFADKISYIFFQKAITKERDINLSRKKYVPAIFS